MIIENLEILNFKNYYGVNKFDFTVDQKRNIILIGGENGAGKTTIPESIRLCLYGRFFRGNLISKNEYETYILEHINKHAKLENDNHMSISATIILEDKFPIQKINVKRDFSINKSNIVETIMLTQDFKPVEIVDKEFWEDYIRSEISPLLAKYFFFDGERVTDIIAGPDAQDYISTSIKEISGLSFLNKLKDDLVTLNKRNVKKSQNTDLVLNIKKNEERIGEIDTEILTLEQSKKEYLCEVDRWQDIKSNLENEIRIRMGFQQEDIDSLDNQLKSSNDEHNSLSANLQQFFKDVLPFLICKKQISDLKQIIEHERTDTIRAEAVDLVKNRALIKLESTANDFCLSQKEILSMKTLLLSVLENLNDDDISTKSPLTTATLSIRQMDLLKLMLEEISGDFEDVMEDVVEFYKLKIRIKKISKELRDNLKNDINQEFDQQVDEANTETVINQTRLDTILEKIETLYDSKLIIQQKISALEESAILSDLQIQKKKLIHDLIIEIDKRIDETTLKSISILEKNINYIYQRLIHKEDLVKSIIISKDDFSINLLGHFNDVVNKKSISEGEKGILALSIQYGLSKLTSKKLPIIIDSPLGKMDTYHVQKILTEYYPNAGHQIIILSHDREVVGEALDIIKSKISRKYLLSLHDKDKIQSGYFGGL